MLSIGGINALSEFRKRSVIKQAVAINQPLKSISAEYVHFVDSNNLNDEEISKLEELLKYGDKFTEKREGKLVF